MTHSRELARESALRHNANTSIAYTPENIDADFAKDNAAILSEKRGAGYWLWKPYFILRRLREIKDGEILVYADAGVEVVNNLRWITDRMTAPLFLFGTHNRQSAWTKRDLFKALGADTPEQHNAEQVNAAVIFIRKTPATVYFIETWSEVCEAKPHLLDDSPSKAPNLPDFVEHRHDQAVLSVLANKEGYRCNWFPAQYGHHVKGDYPIREYPQIFNHHRTRNA
jgi:hypothetical protein